MKSWKTKTIRESLIHSWCILKKNMAHLLYMDLFGGDWGQKERRHKVLDTPSFLWSPLDFEEVTSCRILYKVKLLKKIMGILVSFGGKYFSLSTRASLIWQLVKAKIKEKKRPNKKRKCTVNLRKNYNCD